jgi:hypothetical protein
MRNRKCGQFFKAAERFAFEYVSGNTFNEPIKRHVQTVFAVYTHRNNLKVVEEPAYSIKVLGHIFRRHFVSVRLYGVELRPLRTEVYGKCLFVFKDLPTPPAKPTKKVTYQ